MNPRSVFSIRIDSLSDPLANLCQSVIAACNDGSEISVQQQIAIFKQVIVKEENLVRVLSSCAKIGAQSPLQSIEQFSQVVPPISITQTEAPEHHPEHRMIYIDRLPKQNWGKMYFNICLYFVSDLVTAFFIEKLSENMINVTKSDVVEFINTIIRNFFTCSQDSYIIAIKEINSKYYRRAFGLMSKFAPDDVADLLQNTFMNVNELGSYYQIVVNYFSDCVFSFESYLDAKELLDKIVQVYKEKTVHKQRTSIMNTGLFIYNYLGNTFSKFQESLTDPYIFGLISDCMTWVNSKQLNVHCFEIMALINSFMTINSNTSVKEFGAQHIFSYLSDGKQTDGQILDALSIMLRGAHYSTRALQETTKSNYEHHISDTSTIENIFGYAVSHIDIFDTCQTNLASFIVQIAASDFDLFVHKFLEKLTTPEIISFATCALSKAFFVILDPTSGFAEKAFNFTKELLDKVRISASLLLDTQLSKNITDKPTNFAYEPLSFSNELRNRYTIETQISTYVYRLLGVFTVNMRPKSVFPKHTKENQKWKDELTKEHGVQTWPVYDKNTIREEIHSIQTDENNLMINLLRLSPMIVDNFSILNHVIKFICNEDSSIGAMAVVAVQAALHLNPKFASQIFETVDKYYSIPNITSPHLFILLKFFHCIIDTITMERLEITKEMNTILIKYILLGLCSDALEIRNAAFQCSQNYPVYLQAKNEIFVLYDMIQKNEVQIGMTAKLNALSSLCPNKRDLIQSFDSIPFTNLFLAFDQTFYPFWISALGNLIGETKEDFIPEIHKYYSEVLLNNNSLSNQTLINLCSLHFSLSIGGTQTENISKITTNLLQNFSKNVKNRDCNLCAVMSSCNPIISNDVVIAINSELNTISEKMVLIHVLFYLLSKMSEKPSFIAKQTSGEKFSQPLQESIYFLENYLITNKFVSKNLEFNFDRNELSKPQNYLLQCAIHDMSICLRHLFDEITQQNICNLHGPFPLSKSVSNTYSHSSGTMLTFLVFISLSSCDDTFIFNDAVLNCFSSLCSVANIPDAYFTVVSDNLTKIKSVKLKTNLLRRYFSNLITQYIDYSCLDSSFFHAICLQFTGDQKFKRNWRESNSSEYNENEIEIGNKIYMNSGSLLALAFYYMTNELPSFREMAFKLVSVLSASLFIQEKGLKEFDEFLLKLKKFRGRFKTDMTHYIFTDAISLLKLISNELPFLGEQFIAQMIEIDKRINHNSNKIIHEEGSKRSMTFTKINSEQLVPKFNLETDNLQTHVSSFNLNQNESQKSLAAEFIVPWMSYFVVQPQMNSIFMDIPQIFNCYTFLIFVEDLISMNFSIPIQKIFRQIIEKDHGEKTVDLLLCIALRHVFLDNLKENAMELIRFLFAIQSDLVFKHMLKYIEFDAWHFYCIQLNKLDLLFDFDHVMAEISNKAEDEIKSTGTVNTEDDQSNDYSFIVPIVLDMIYNLILDDLTLIREYGKIILSYSFIQFHSFPEQCSKLIKLLTSLEVPDNFTNYYSDTTKTIITKVGTWPLDLVGSLFSNLNENEARKLYNYLLPWAVSYGKTYKTPIAVKILDSIGMELEKDDVIGLCRSILVIAIALYERTTPSIHAANIKKITFFVQLLDNFGKPPYAELYGYLTYAIYLLKRSKEITTNLVYFISEFLKCSSIEYVSIFNAAADFILLALNKNEFIEQIKTSEMPKDFEGIAHRIFAANLDSIGLSKSFEIIQKCIENDLLTFLTPTDDYNVLIASLLPFANMFSPSCVTKIAKLSNDSVLENCFIKITESDTELSENIEAIVSGLITDEKVALKVLPFYVNVENNGNVRQKLIIYYATSFIIRSIDNISFKDYSIGNIARSAVKSNIPGLQRAASNLLQTLMEVSGGEFCYSSSFNMAGNPQFPSISDILNLKPHEWRCTTLKLTPIYVTHEGFIACAIFSDLRAALEQVQAQPFSEWGEIEYKMQAAVPQGQNEDISGIKSYEEMTQIIRALTRNSRKSFSNKSITPVESVLVEEKLINAVDFAPSPKDFGQLLKDLNEEDAPPIF
ncbi:hypothetical protein TVAG_038470 [Trichomonas vaginalis G3]|uniref:Uncharacterized protein n=1 Tax=Trichomonas vaginalis (strain ATCC PRA-98 / G3) TaxID=412133 RepID=A2DY03_TRIV3|nr:hypothetical protein TVAGG3_0960770 [Trichomonas vaginalis G3]EAY14739.1 hypothetical protein TVAG_038470 [Trichomonas vaginalis G3]KAI5487890.1 hypothetical protein TVAGG3_0960770 [Trichomonas vaginalis G3]|eukprot:XP_001326962.1 hypothetical protein [Trichomonas vaginalis G3]